MADETLRCPLCAGDGPFAVLEEGIEPPYRVLGCSFCDYGFVHPLPSRERLAAAYGAAYYEPWQQEQKARRQMWEKRLQTVQRFAPQGRLLDVGAAEGEFLSLAACAGYQVAATEFSKAAVQALQKRFPNAEVFLGEIEALALPEAHFDLITAWHTLEHMRFPFAALSAMRRALKAGGHLFVAVPNRNNLLMRALYRLVRGRPYPLFSLHTKEIHLSHFTPKSLARALTQAGFTVQAIGWDRAMVEPAKRMIDAIAALPFFLGGPLWTEAMLAVARKPEA